MLAFKHCNQDVILNGGETWAPNSVPQDTYRDAPSRELEELTRQINRGKAWRKAVAEKYAKTNKWLCDIVTSPARDLYFRQHPPAVGSRVLDIGAGWGQIALPIAKRDMAEVVAVEPTPERLGFIEAIARQEGVLQKMILIQADFFELQFEPRFDLISCVGVLEWAPRFREGSPREVQLAFLRLARSALAVNGRLVIGIENRLGLKYLLGAPDDHIGAANVAVYDAEFAAQKWLRQSGQVLRSYTYTRAELEALLREAGFARFEFHAALPDYKLPQKILPLGSETNRHFAEGTYIPEHDGCAGKALPFQAELQSHYRSFAALGVASDFAPSFFVSAAAD